MVGFFTTFLKYQEYGKRLEGKIQPFENLKVAAMGLVSAPMLGKRSSKYMQINVKLVIWH